MLTPMKRALWICGGGLAALLLVATVVTYSWTFTPLGRLDYGAAVMARLRSWQTGPMEITPEARARANEVVLLLVDREPVSLPRIEDRRVPSGAGEIPVRIYWPAADEPLPLYLDIHGGGWWMGDGFPFHAPLTRFAAASGAIVVSVDYRLAPEHPYPAALDDVMAVLSWLHENAESLGGDPDRIAVGGASAGGNLAAALTLRARDEGGPKIRFQYLLFPATDLSDRHDWPSFAETGDAYGLKVSWLDSMIAAYVPDADQRTDPYVSPLLAESHAGLPPALIVTALFDPLRDQGEAYARALEEAGVPVRLHREPGALHGFAGSPARAEKIRDLAARSVLEALAP